MVDAADSLAHQVYNTAEQASVSMCPTSSAPRYISIRTPIPLPSYLLNFSALNYACPRTKDDEGSRRETGQ